MVIQGSTKLVGLERKVMEPRISRIGLGGSQTTKLVLVYMYICSFQVNKWREKILSLNHIPSEVSVAERLRITAEGSGEWN